MKSRHLACFLLAAQLLGATGSIAVAGEGMEGAGGRWRGYPDPRPPAGMQERRNWENGREEDREARREARRQWLNSRRLDEGRGAVTPGGSDDSWRHRLSPEERQRLRQDINEAGRDVYPRDSRPPSSGAFLPPRHP